MRKRSILLPGLAACLVLAAGPSYASNKAVATSKTTAAKTVAAGHWQAETLSGKIESVEPNQKLVVVKDASGTAFDMKITRSTRILSGKQAVSLKELQQDQNQQVTVRFVPERRGDVATLIRLNG